MRDENVHHRFKPGTAWWLLYNCQKSSAKYPDALTFPEQIMVTISNFKNCLGTQWNQHKELHFPDLRFNRYNRAIFVTVKVALENDGYGLLVSHPTVDSIIDRKRDRISYEKLQIDIIPEQPSTVFDIDLFLHLKGESISELKSTPPEYHHGKVLQKRAEDPPPPNAQKY